MYVVEVIPLKKGGQLESLTYFSSQPYDFGTIVTIPLRSKEARAVVVSSVEASSAKTALRAATFSLRKLPLQTETSSLAPGLIKTAQSLQKEYPFGLGTILFSLLPSEIKNGQQRFPQIYSCDPSLPEKRQPEILLASRQDRFVAYRSLIRNTFAHGGSVLVVVPTVAYIDDMVRHISAGIADRVVALQSGTVKKRTTGYAAYDDCSKAKVIVCTTTHAFLDRHDVTTIIVDHARSQHFNGRTQPYLDYRTALISYAAETQKRIVLADTLLRSEEEAKLRNGKYIEHDEHPKRLALPAKLLHIKRPLREQGQTYEILTPKITEHIDKTLSARRNVFIYAPRRGLAPIVTCSDCGHIFVCKDSGAPYTLMKTKENGEEKRWFVAKTTGQRIPAPDVCPVCNSWKLREQGIGIQKVYDTVRKLFPQHSVVLFDSETAKTSKRAELLMKSFYKEKGAILIGTSMVFPYLTEPVTTSIISSLEAVRATPTWRSQEEFFALLLTLRELSTDTVLIQSKEEADDTVELAKKGMVEQFYTEELELRKILNYPPHARFVRLTWRGRLQAGRAFGEKMKLEFDAYNIKCYADPNTTGELRIFYALIRVAETDWPDKRLMEKLRNLPPSVRIMLNPDRII